MRNAKMLVALALVLLIPACGPIEWLNPCYKEEDLVLEPALAGSWKDEDGTSVLKFREAGGKSYEMLDTEVHQDGSEPERTQYDAHLVRLGDRLFLDLVPAVAQVSPGAYKLTIAPSAEATAPPPLLTKVADGLYASLVPAEQASEAGHVGECCEVRLIQSHWVLQVQLDGTSLRLVDLNEEWFEEAVNQGRIRLGFERIDDTVVLTGSTEELRQFLLDYGGDELAFPDDGDSGFRRQE